MDRKVSTYSVLLACVMLLMPLSQQAQAQQGSRIRARVGMDIKGNRDLQRTVLKRPSLEVNVFQEHALFRDLGGQFHIGIGQISSGNAQLFYLPVDYRLQYYLRDLVGGGWLSRSYLFGGLGAMYYNPISILDDNPLLTNPEITNSPLFDFESGINLFAPVGIGFILAENKLGRISLNLNYNNTVHTVRRSTEFTFPDSYVGISLRFSFGKSIFVPRLASSPNSPARDLDTPYTPTPLTHFTDPGAGLYTREIKRCRSMVAMGPFSGTGERLEEALILIRQIRKHHQITLDIAFNEDGESFTISGRGIANEDLSGILSDLGNYSGHSFNMGNDCETVENRLLYRIQVGAFLNPEYAIRFALESKRELNRVTIINSPGDPFFRVLLNSGPDEHAAEAEQKKISLKRSYHDAFVTHVPRRKELVFPEKYAIQLGSFRTPSLAENFAQKIKSETDVQPVVGYSEFSNSFVIYSQPNESFEDIKLLKEELIKKEVFRDPIIVVYPH